MDHARDKSERVDVGGAGLMAVHPALASLLTVDEVAALRVGKPIAKPKTRLEETAAERPLTKVDEKKFRADVWERDGGHCRCCLRKVLKTIARVPEQGHVHHLHGRLGDLLHEVRAAILVCLQCHERLTGKVNAHRLTAIGSATFEIRQGIFTDARQPITFQEAA